MLTRADLAKRWRLSLRTVDRMRETGVIPWVDLNGGKGRRPLVRFRPEDVAAIENQILGGMKTGTEETAP